MTYKIDKGIPVPVSRGNGKAGRRTKYPLPDMKVGDSFLIPMPADQTKKRYLAQQNATGFARSLGMKVTTRAVEGGVRIWRVK